jgi:phosphate starvation-inducible PhoH-like protein
VFTVVEDITTEEDKTMEELNIVDDDDIDDVIHELTSDQMREMAKKHRKPKVRTDLPPRDMTPVKKPHLRDLVDIHPMTEMQSNYFAGYEDNPDKHFLVIGSAGTGKTFLTCNLGIKEILTKGSVYEKLIIVRSAVESGAELGFRPGTVQEKMADFEEPYREIFAELFDRSTAYEHLKEAGIVSFGSTSFLRGRSINNTIVVVDEIQNMNFGELDTVITRVGYNSKIIFCGDYRQNDLINKRNTKSGMHDFVNILDRMKHSFLKFEFGHEDIVRSGLVKDYIITKEKYQEQQDVAAQFGTIKG